MFHRASSSHKILAAAGGGRAIAFDSTEELSALQVPIAKALLNLALAAGRFGAVNPTAYEAFLASAVARRFADIFDDLATQPPRTALFS
jgi:hypothetical protein